MDTDKIIRYTTFLLALAAGYCDTVTFVAAEQLFSAHVTGNFIVLAYDIVKKADAQAWIKLITFPVFILSVICGGRIAGSTPDKYKLLMTEAAVLIIAGMANIILGFFGISGLHWQTYTLAMFVVFAMGLQNAFGKIFSKETIGPTTMMTGNVTQAALDIGGLIHSPFTNQVAMGSLKKQLITIGGFLVGCLAGGFLGKAIGITAVIIPGLVLLFFAIRCQALSNSIVANP